MNLINWTPFQDMDSFFDRRHRLMNPGDWPESGKFLSSGELDWRPRADVSESNEQYLIKADLPEVEKDDIQVSVENGILTISGERRYEKDDSDETSHRIERMYGKFSRSFQLPADADESSIKADSAKGVLKVRIPKVEIESSKSIDIAVD